MISIMHNSFLKVVLFFLLTGLTTLLYSQNGHYIGSEQNISGEWLTTKAKHTDFQNRYAAKIYEDAKNSYYAVATAAISSEYVKIRMLEMVYQDSLITSISGNMRNPYLFFLVNKSLNKSERDVLSLFEHYKSTAENEKAKLSSEELVLWLQQHNKYSK